jgi:nucleoside-triphosphatase
VEEPIRHVLVTGRPGCGKTTLVLRIAAALSKRGVPVAGFVTEEVRSGGARTGFAIRTLDGREGTLADSSPGPGPRVGRYRVDVADVELLCVPLLLAGPPRGPDGSRGVLVADELGRMELCCPAFLPAARAALAEPGPVLATVPVADAEPFRSLRSTPGARLVECSPASRDRLAGELTELLERLAWA